MATEVIKQPRRNNYKVMIFWALIFAITALFAVLFVVRFAETRVIDSYEDIERADLNLVYDITSEENSYYVYVYSAKENDKGKLVDTAKSDIQKANDVFPTVLNYFNYVKRNERANANNVNFMKIYGYNVKNNEKDSNLKGLDLKVADLPALVKVDGNSNSINETITSATTIQKTLSEVMNK